MRLTFTSFLVCIAVSLSAQSVLQHKTDSVTRLIKDYYNKKAPPVPTDNALQSSLDKKTDSMAQAFIRSVIILTNANLAPDAIGVSLLNWLNKK